MRRDLHIMAVRLNPKQDERARSAIKTSQLINRLNCFALDIPGPQGEKVELDANKLRAIDTLLKKTLPDLSSVTVEGNPDKPLKAEVSAAEAILQALNGIAERKNCDPSRNA